MKPNKKLFFDVLKQIGIYCQSEGFVEHPAYVSAWEPTNQAYQATLIRSNVSDFIDQLNVSFHPSWPAFRFGINRSNNSFGFDTIDDLPADAGEWTNCWLYRPFDEYLLKCGTAWNILPSSFDFRVGKRKPMNVEAETLKVCTAFERNSVFLFNALRGSYRGRLVDVRHQEIRRPQ